MYSCIYAAPEINIEVLGSLFCLLLESRGLHGKIISVMLSNHPLILHPLRS